MQTLQVALLPGNDESLDLSLPPDVTAVMRPLIELGTHLSLHQQPEPEDVAASYLPELQAVVATVPWAAIAAGIADITALLDRCNDRRATAD